MSSASFGSLPFAEQIEFFRSKVSIPTLAWTDIYTYQHDYAFMVAGASKSALLNDLRGAIDGAIANGTTLDQFRKDFDGIVAKNGWAYNGGRNWRTRVIYETNLRTAYAAGREIQMADPELRKRRPYGLYRHGGSEEPRPEHLAMDGVTVPLDDPFWDEWTPPGGWGCSCKKFMVSDADVERLGLTVQDPGPISPREEKTIGINGPSPRTVSVPVGIDPGFEYRPGARSMALLRQVGTGTAPDIAAAYAQAIAPIVARVIQRDFDSWIDRVLGDTHHRGRAATVGLLLPAELLGFSSRGQVPKRTDISITDALVLGPKRGRHQQSGDGLSDDEWRSLPSMLANRRAAVWDKANKTVLLILDADGDDRSVKVAVRADYMGSAVNSVRTAYRINVQALRDQKKYPLIWGEI